MAQKVNALPIGVQKVNFRFRNHLLPPVLGIAATFLVYALLNFPSFEAQAQYYINRFGVQPTHNAVLPAVPANQSEIIIPGIKVKAPIVYETSADNGAIAYDLRSGVVHYGTTALPGEKGNVAIFGHSSGVAWAPGDYKFVFTLLDKVQNGQQVTLDYKGVRYVYVVTGSEVVAPTDMRILESKDSQSELSLITCTPVGTSKNRLVVHAKQVSPDPAANKPFTPKNGTSGSLPGN